MITHGGKQCHFYHPWLGMVSLYSTTYKNGDDWGMVQMALFYPHYWKKAPVEETPMRVGFRLRASEGLVV